MLSPDSARGTRVLWNFPGFGLSLLTLVSFNSSLGEETKPCSEAHQVLDFMGDIHFK